jgi:hypothetical protein
VEERRLLGWPDHDVSRLAAFRLFERSLAYLPAAATVLNDVPYLQDPVARIDVSCRRILESEIGGRWKDQAIGRHSASA